VGRRSIASVHSRCSASTRSTTNTSHRQLAVESARGICGGRPVGGELCKRSAQIHWLAGLAGHTCFDLPGDAFEGAGYRVSKRCPRLVRLC
jgi:hypothetical protein